MSTQPSCYGKSWDPNHVECKGGLDAAYENPRDKTHRRDRCAWFVPCSQTMNFQGTAQPTPQPVQSQQIIPTRSLLHRPAVDVPPPRPIAPQPQPPYTPPRPPTHIPAPTPSYQHYPQYAAPPPQQQHQPMQQYMAAPMQMVPPHVAQYGPQLVYQPYQHPSMQMPNYLTVPEPVMEGDSYMGRLGRDLARRSRTRSPHSSTRTRSAGTASNERPGAPQGAPMLTDERCKL
jgi:hypothetical protein